MTKKTRTRLLVGAAALALGLLLAFLLPASWVYSDGGAAAGHDHGVDGPFACPMFCVIMDEPPADNRCPVCGMEMTPVSSEARLDAHEQHMVGLETTRIERLPLARTVRVVGEVDYDETRLSRITTRVSGWLEAVHVDATWMPVSAGDPLAEIYSPELYAAQEEYLVARGAGEGMVAAAERRLRLLGVGPREIDALRERGEARATVLLRAPRDGVVVERRAIAGASVGRGALLYTVADLSRVWLQAEVFERDLTWVYEGQAARLALDGVPEVLEGTVAFVDPVIDRRSRTTRVRIEAENPRGPEGRRLLRIGQRVDVRLSAALAADGTVRRPGDPAGPDPLAVPRSAVLSTGQRDVVYVLFTETPAGAGSRRIWDLDPAELSDPVFYEMVPVILGPPARPHGDAAATESYPLLGIRESAGAASTELTELREGLVVVTNGNLLLDSQAQLSGRPSLLFPEGSRGGSSDPHAGH